MKRILLVTYYFGNSGAVGAKRLNDLYAFLSKRYKSVIVSYKKSATENYIQKNNKRNKSKLSIGRCFRSLDKTILGFAWIKEFFQVIRKEDRIDVVIASYKPSWSILIGIVFAKYYRAKLILEYRDLASLFGRKKKIFVLHQLDKIIDTILVNMADEVVVVSPTQKRLIKKISKKPVTIITNGFNEVIENNKPLNNKTLQLIYAGTLSEYRNLKSVYEFCCKHFKNFILKVASQTNPKLEYLNFDNVIYLGYIGSEKLKEEYLKADYFILLEGSGEESAENIPAKFFEYLSYKKPILADVYPHSDIQNIMDEINCGFNIKSKNEFSNNYTYNNALDRYSRTAQFEKYIDLIETNIKNG